MANKLICQKCNTEIAENLIACKGCAKRASVLWEREVEKRAITSAFRGVAGRWRDLWIGKKLTDTGEIQLHFAWACYMEWKTFAFCGTELGVGVPGDQGGGQITGDGKVDLDYGLDDPRACPLCVDRIRNNGGGICASVCLSCGTADERHHPQCQFYLPEISPAEAAR